MSLITWNESYNVNVPELDAQHQRLVAMINNLHAAMTAGRAKEVIVQTLTNLLGYTRYHFLAEQKLLAAAAYPELAWHTSEHDRFTKQVIEFQKSYEAGTIALSIATLRFLRDWLINHILGSDKKYSEFLAAKTGF